MKNNRVLPFSVNYNIRNLSFIFDIDTNSTSKKTDLWNVLKDYNTELDRGFYGACVAVLLAHAYVMDNHLETRLNGVQLCNFLSNGYKETTRIIEGTLEALPNVLSVKVIRNSDKSVVA